MLDALPPMDTIKYHRMLPYGILAHGDGLSIKSDELSIRRKEGENLDFEFAISKIASKSKTKYLN